MSSSLSLYARSLFVLIAVAVSLLWSQAIEQSSSGPLLFGVYGQAPITIKCPRDGSFQALLTRGDSVQRGQNMFHFQSDHLRLLRREVTHKGLELSAELKRSLITADQDFDLNASQRLDRVHQRQANLWGYRAQRAQAQAKIQALTQELGGLRGAVKSGAAPLRDLLTVKAEIKSAQALIKPLKNQEFSQGSERQGEIEELKRAQESLHSAYQDELASWRQAEQTLEALIQELELISSPVDGVVMIAQPDESRRGSCLAGETLMTIQPTQTVVRLWQVTLLDQPVEIGLSLRAYSALPSQMKTHMTLNADVTWMSSKMDILPPELQSIAQKELGLTPLFGAPTAVYGRAIEAHLSPSIDHSNVRIQAPWGLPLVAQP